MLTLILDNVRYLKPNGVGAYVNSSKLQFSEILVMVIKMEKKYGKG